MQLVADGHDVAFAGVVPKVIVVAPGTNPVPVTVTVVPPAADPVVGEMFVIVGDCAAGAATAADAPATNPAEHRPSIRMATLASAFREAEPGLRNA